LSEFKPDVLDFFDINTTQDSEYTWAKFCTSSSLSSPLKKSAQTNVEERSLIEIFLSGLQSVGS
jgi:hypothetical protein